MTESSTASPTDLADLSSRLEFLRGIERLKSTLRSAHASNGRVESAAEHSWRLAMLAWATSDLLREQFPGLRFERLIKICLVHDLGEAIGGDVPAPEQRHEPERQERERRDLQTLIAPLPGLLRSEFLELWDEYHQLSSDEARVARALDKVETIAQHNQGANPPDFDYVFNLRYGRGRTDAVDLARRLRALLDEQTRELAG